MLVRLAALTLLILVISDIGLTATTYSYTLPLENSSEILSIDF